MVMECFKSQCPTKLNPQKSGRIWWWVVWFSNSRTYTREVVIIFPEKSPKWHNKYSLFNNHLQILQKWLINQFHLRCVIICWECACDTESLYVKLLPGMLMSLINRPGIIDNIAWEPWGYHCSSIQQSNSTFVNNVVHCPWLPWDIRHDLCNKFNNDSKGAMLEDGKLC